MKAIRILACAVCVTLLFALPVSAKTVIIDTESGESAEELMSLEAPKSLSEVVSTGAGTALEVGGKSAILMELS